MMQAKRLTRQCRDSLATRAAQCVVLLGVLVNAAHAQDLIRVNGHGITLQQIEAVNPQSADNPSVRQQVAEQLAQQQLLADLIKVVPPVVEARISAEQQNLKRQALAQWAAQDYLQAHPISQATIEQAYAKSLAALPAKQYWLRWIVVKTPKEATGVIEALRAGKQGFSNLALTQSVGQNAELGGALGWQSEQSMSAAVLSVVRKLKVGEVAGPISLGSDFAIVQLLAERDTPKPSLEQLRPQIEQQLRATALQAYVAELAKAAKIENLTPSPAPPSSAAKNEDNKNVEH